MSVYRRAKCVNKLDVDKGQVSTFILTIWLLLFFSNTGLRAESLQQRSRVKKEPLQESRRDLQICCGEIMF